MKYYACLPDKCLSILNQLQIDLRILEKFDGLLKQIHVNKFFPSAINNSIRFREILLRYFGYFASEWRIYRIIKDQIHGGPQRIAFVILQQLNAEAEEEFRSLAMKYKHIDLETEQTTLTQSIHKSIKVQQGSIYQSQRLRPNEKKKQEQQQQQKQVPYQHQMQQQQQMQYQAQQDQYNQYYQQQQQYYQQQQQFAQQQATEIQQLKEQLNKLQQENETEKEKRKLLQEQLSENTKQMMELQKENSQLKQKVSEQQSKEKSSRTKDEKKMKEFQSEKLRLEKEVEDMKQENQLLKKQIENEKRKTDDQLQQIRCDKIVLENLLMDEKQKNQQLREEMSEMKKKQVDIDSKEETREFDIPLQFFYEGKQYVFNHRGLQFSIPTMGQIEDEKRYIYNGYGTPLNGQPRDLVVVSRFLETGEYEREGYNLIKRIFYDQSNSGKQKQLQIVLPNMVIETFDIIVVEGMFEIPGYGLMNNEGVRGSLVIDIQLLN